MYIKCFMPTARQNYTLVRLSLRVTKIIDVKLEVNSVGKQTFFKLNVTRGTKFGIRQLTPLCIIYNYTSWLTAQCLVFETRI